MNLNEGFLSEGVGHSRENIGFGPYRLEIQIFTLSLTSYVIFNMVLNFFMDQNLHMVNNAQVGQLSRIK